MIPRWVAALWVVSIAVVGDPAWAQPAPSAAAPSAAAPSASPSAAAPPESAAPGPTTPASPHARPPADGPQNSSDLAPGTIEVLVRDPQGNPLGNTAVKLNVLRSSIEQGDTRSDATVLSDPLGKAFFAGLATTTDFSYRITIQAGPAVFGTAQFPLRRETGHRELLTVYPVTRDQKQAQVVGRGVIAVHPRDDVFVVDVLYQLINVGRIAWVPDALTLKLPTGWNAFTAQEGAGDTAFQEAGDVGAKLVGTFTPGSHEVGFRFQLPNPHEATLAMTMPLFPRTVEMRVIVDASSDMTLQVANYGDSFPDRMRSGQRVLVAQRNYLELRENSPETIGVTIGGMRTRGQGHHWALAIALGTVVFGLWNAWQQPRQPTAKSRLASADLRKARELLLDELVALEHARERKAIGTKAYEQTRQVLVTSLARLESAASS